MLINKKIKKTKQISVNPEVKKRCWRWIGHTLLKPDNNITMKFFHWNQLNKINGGRYENKWIRAIETGE